MSYRIGSFNMYKFSFQSDEKIKKDGERLSEIIKKNFDIVAMQEVLTPNAISDWLMRYLGSNWEFRWGQPEQGKKSSMAIEGYAFIWNKRVFRLAEKYDRQNRLVIEEPKIASGYHLLPGKGDLIRPPYCASFIPVNGPFMEIRLINTHIIYSADSGKVEAEEEERNDVEENISDANARRDELELLVRKICTKYGNERKGINRPAYTFLLGDYNLNLRAQGNKGPFLEPYIIVNDSRQSQVYVTVQAEKTTLKQVKSINDETDEKYSNNYDHFTYDEERLVRQLGLKLTPRRIDTLNDEWCEGNVEKHRRNISDHVPICLEITINMGK